jgi:carbonic anhydrase/acetyltransferase-like protein (isoleucine patch superfamily)
VTIYRLGELLPEIDPEAWVAPDANVIGRVVLGKGASVWFGATLRGDNEPIAVGAGSNVQDSCVFHTDPGYPLTVGRDCTIGHKAILHGCMIGDETLIGMGAIVQNGARIGNNCLIGAGALVTEGKEIPDGSLVVGAPGKVIRQLDERALAGIRTAAQVYRERARTYRVELRAL